MKIRIAKKILRNVNGERHYGPKRPGYKPGTAFRALERWRRWKAAVDDTKRAG